MTAAKSPSRGVGPGRWRDRRDGAVSPHVHRAGAAGARIVPARRCGTAADRPCPGSAVPACWPARPDAVGYVPGVPIISTAVLGEGLARLQAGESVFDLVDGTSVQFSGIPVGQHNVLRDLQASPLGKKVSQLESMTIELVAMLFDFIFETKDLPDGIKALLARLQIPVLKAAMLDSAFFAKKSHPSRLLVNALAEAGLGWSPVMGTATRSTRRSRRSSTASSTASPTTSRLRRAARGPRGVPRSGGEGGRG